MGLRQERSWEPGSNCQLRPTTCTALEALLKELSSYPFSSSERLSDFNDPLANEVAIPLRLKTPRGVLSFLGTVTVFGTPVEITLSEVTLEAFYPADQETAQVLGVTK
jgi:hypothetical protein